MAALEIFGRRLEINFRQPAGPPRRRNFEAAKIDRLTSGWPTVNTDANALLRQGLRVIRARSRELAINNDYMIKFLSLLRKNVVGPQGIRLRANPINGRDEQRPGELDAGAKQLLESSFRRWGETGSCTMDGRHSWLDVQKLAISSIARDGEVLVRHVVGRAAPNEFAYGLQLIEADQLDEDFNTILPNGNRVFMGVEVDQWFRRVAYHLLRDHPGAEAFTVRQRQRDRVPAAAVTHLFVDQRINQARGIPWAHTAMNRLYQLGRYEEAEIVASRAAASKMLMYETDFEGVGDAWDADDADDQGNLINEFEAGVAELLPPGVKAHLIDPTHPNATTGAFIKAMLRGIAAGLDVNYNTLANDLEGVNFSSLRQGNIDERDAWRVIQAWLVEHLHAPVYRNFVRAALATPALNLPPSRAEKFQSAQWQARGWQWVDPQKEARANSDEVAMGTKSRQQIAAESGRDFEDILDELAEEKAMAEAKGLTLKGAANNASPGPPQDDDEED